MKRILSWRTLKSFFLAFLRRLFEDLKEVQRWIFKEKGNPFGFPFENLHLFPYPEELPLILEMAKSYFPKGATYPLNPYALLLAIRLAERGKKGFEFGVVAQKDTDLKTQTEWACATIKKNLDRFQKSKEQDFIAFLGRRWAPPGAENDPEGLNRFWVENVRFFYQRYHKDSPSPFSESGFVHLMVPTGLFWGLSPGPFSGNQRGIQSFSSLLSLRKRRKNHAL